VFEFIKRLIPHRQEGSKIGSSSMRNDLDTDQTVMKSFSKSHYRAASCQSSGRERSHNEDTLFIFSVLLDGINSPIFFGLYLVADGMGGHQSGEVASSLAVQGFSQYLIEHIYKNYIYNHQTIPDEILRHYLENAVEEAQTLIKRRVPGGGTTLTGVITLNNLFFCVHIGDSRLYLIDKDGKLSLQTKDHTLVKRLVDLGEITEEEASLHPERNVLYRALGQMNPLHADISQFSLQKGERFLICSDGLWGVVADQQVEAMVNHSHNLNDLACDLVRKANEEGGPDNISVVLVERLG